MMSGPERLTIATRGSALALRQARSVAELVRALAPDTHVVLRPITTAGDRDRRPFAQIGGKGLFMAEVEREIVEGRADVAVHSAKDLTAELAPGCTIVAIPDRAVVHDVVVGGSSGDGRARLASLPPGARVGTSSMRRRALLSEARPDLEPVELRGNLDTRLIKVQQKSVDVAIVAAAGIDRLGAEVDVGALDPDWWIPAPAQGALAVEAPASRADLVELFATLSEPGAAAEVECERAFAARLEGGCSIPLGCLARSDGASLSVAGYVGSPNGGQGLRDRTSGPTRLAHGLGVELAQALIDAGADELIADARDSQQVRPSPP